MNNIYNIVSDMDIAVGNTKRMNCPVCKGYKTFTVTNNMGSLVWNCYKVSCGTKGGQRVQLSVEDIRAGFSGAEKFAEGEEFVLPEWVVPHNNRVEVLTYANEWGINYEQLMYDVRESRVVFPVMHGGQMVDATGRSLSSRLPKWKRYGKGGVPYSYGSGHIAVVVEDCVSAAVVGNDVFVGVAVLGTSLSDSHKRYLAQFSTAVIALDPDALPKTLAFAKELKGYVNTVKVLRLTDDLKYRNPTDITNLNSIGEQHGTITD